MKTHLQIIVRIKDQSGVSAIVVAIVLAVLIGVTALAVDIGYLMTAKNELQNVADAAALAAARKLGFIYQNMTYQQQLDYVCDRSTIVPVAQETAQENRAAGKDVTINDADVFINHWEGTPFNNNNYNRPDAVRVIARRDGNANGPIATFFARILGIYTVGVGADATAALTGQATAGKGDLELPVGISEYFFQPGSRCNDFVVFSPTNDPDSCAGWTSFDISPSSDITLRRILQGVDGYENPDTLAGDSVFEFIGGDLSVPTFDALLMRFKVKGYDYNYIDGASLSEQTYDPVQTDTDGNGNQVPVMGSLTEADGAIPMLDADGNQLLYPDGTPRNHHVWIATVLVYEWYDCSNPNTSIRISGFSTIRLVDVRSQGGKKILIGQVLCNRVNNDDTRGGGGNYGTLGSIPNLVE